MKRIDLASSSLEPDSLREIQALELRAEQVETEQLEHALALLKAAPGLRSLRLCSRTRALPTALTELVGLQRLEIVDPELPGLPASIDRLTRLRELRLELFHLASLPRSIAGLHRLRVLSIDSHHLCGLPAGLRSLQELRSLTLLLRRVIVPDWQRPAHFRARFEQDLGELFELLAGLPKLSSLTLGEPPADAWFPERTFDRLPDAFAELRGLEQLSFVNYPDPIEFPPGLVMPSVRHIDAGWSQFAATAAELQAMFPGARFSRMYRGIDDC